MAKNLVAAKADFVVCACNTAHAFEKDIKMGCGRVPFLSIIEVTTKQVLRRIQETQGRMRCGILAGLGCVTSGIF
jgi:aspartate racemase